MIRPMDVVTGFTYFGLETLKAFSKDRERADWVEAFYADQLTDAVTQFEAGVIAASKQLDHDCWIAGWACFHQFRKDLRGIANEFESVRRARDQKEYVEQLRKRLA